MYIKLGMRVFTLMAPTKENLINLQPATITSETNKTTLDENGEYVTKFYYGVTPDGSKTEVLLTDEEVRSRYFEDSYDLRGLIEAEIEKYAPQTQNAE